MKIIGKKKTRRYTIRKPKRQTYYSTSIFCMDVRSVEVRLFHSHQFFILIEDFIDGASALNQNPNFVFSKGTGHTHSNFLYCTA